MLFVNDEVADQRGSEDAGEGEDVRDGVDVFVGGEGEDAGLQSFEGGFLEKGNGAVRSSVGSFWM